MPRRSSSVARFVSVAAAVGVLALAASGCSGTSRPSDDALTANVTIAAGRTLYLTCRGSGAPTVVLVSGYRGAHDDWTRVVDAEGEPVPSDASVFAEVGRFTRVCAYDRPGTSRLDGTLTPSTPVVQPTDAPDVAADLRALLLAADQRGPYVVVAHSWGALGAVLFAKQHPDDVSGLVLVDPGSEKLQTTLAPAEWTTFATAARQLGDPETLEAVDYDASVAALRAAPAVRPIPATVLTADQPFDFGAGEGTWPAWLLAHERLADDLGAKHVTDTKSGHFIHGERPGLVSDAIREIVFAAREP